MRLDWRELRAEKAVRQLRKERALFARGQLAVKAALVELDRARRVDPLARIKARAEEMIASRLAEALDQIVDERRKELVASMDKQALASVELSASRDEADKTVVFTAHLPAITRNFDVVDNMFEGIL